MKIVRALYNGTLNPADQVGTRSELYRKVRTQAHTAYETFRSQLPPELLPEYDRLMDKQLELLATGMEEGFVEGTHFGMSLMMEVWNH